MTRRSRRVALAAVLAIGVVVASMRLLDARGTAPTVVDGDAVASVAAASPGAHLHLSAGDHDGPLVIRHPITLTADPDATIVGPPDGPAVLVSGTHDVTLRGLQVIGGSSGIEVRHSDDVTIADARVRGSDLHGIFAHDAEVAVSNCEIAGLRSDLAQGFEIINSDTRDPSVVEGCTIAGPVFEGLTSHVSRVAFTDNVVSGSTERGIAITEMSMGQALRNEVRDATGRAYFCGDMSRCTFLDNVARRIADAGAGWRSSAGHGLVVHFHSTATVKRLRTEDLGGEPVLLMLDSHLERHPSSGLPPMAPLAGVGALYAALLVAARLAGLRGFVAILLPTLALQVGHQLEHTVQLGQLVLGHAATHGLAGAVVDNEWMHLAFNATLLAGMGATSRHRPGRSAAFSAVLVVQAYHVVEHVARVVQYLVTGISPAPGLAGAVVGTGEGLILFHFAVNAVVTLLLLLVARASRPWHISGVSLRPARPAPALGSA